MFGAGSKLVIDHSSGADLRIQQYSCVLWLTEDWQISAASRNCRDVINLDASDFVGLPINALFNDRTCHDLRTNAQVLMNGGSIVHLHGCQLESGPQVDVTMTGFDGAISIEFESYRPRTGLAMPVEQVQRLAERLQRFDELDRLCLEACRIVSALAGFKEIWAFQYDASGQPKILGHNASGLEPGENLGELATKAAQRKATAVALVVDVLEPTVAFDVVPELSSDQATVLRNSMVNSVLTSDVESLMTKDGVRSSLTLPVIIGAQTWGVLQCFDREPRYLSVAQRSALRFLGVFMGYECARVLAL